MKRKIVSDSSANLFKLKKVDYCTVPMKIIAGEKEYVDDANLSVSAMVKELLEYKGKSSTACAAAGEWLEAFGDADEVFGVALTSKISGCYNASQIAREEYLSEHPEKKVFILDSLSTGPELELIVEKYQELALTDKDFDTICEEIKDYANHTHLMFSLASLSNFVKNGRVKPTVAAVASLLGIRIVGQASMEGELEPMNKCRGEKNAVKQLWENMQAAGYAGGRVFIRHTYNEECANKIAALIRDTYPDCTIRIARNKGLCSYYAEPGSVLIGFEGAAKNEGEK